MFARTSTFFYSLVFILILSPDAAATLLKIFATEQLSAKIELSTLSMKKVSGCVVQGLLVPSRQMVKVLETKVGVRTKGNFILIVACKVSPLLKRPGTVQVRQTHPTPIGVYTCAARDKRARECFLRLFRKKTVVADL